MMYCIFQNNQIRLFCVDGVSLEVSHSYIEHSSLSFYTGTPVTTSNKNSFTNRMTYELQFFDSVHCSTDSPARTLKKSPMSTLEDPLINTPEKTTPINTPEETPMKTLEETPINTP